MYPLCLDSSHHHVNTYKKYNMVGNSILANRSTVKVFEPLYC